jgi:outer membrane protein TolC
MTLQLDLLNAENALENADIQLQKAEFSFLIYFNISSGVKIHLTMPQTPELETVSAEEALSLMKSNHPDILGFRKQTLDAEQELEQEVLTTVADFNRQQRLITKSEEALRMAIESYNIYKQRFIVGKADINTLTLSLNRRKEAQRNYLATLNPYWRTYYAIRRLTFYDFVARRNLEYEFEKLLNK